MGGGGWLGRYSKSLKWQSKAKSKVGTAAYIAPEVITAQRGSNYNGNAVDVWSSGVVLHTMLAGMYPFCDPHMPNDEVCTLPLPPGDSPLVRVAFWNPSHRSRVNSRQRFHRGLDGVAPLLNAGVWDHGCDDTRDGGGTGAHGEAHHGVHQRRGAVHPTGLGSW